MTGESLLLQSLLDELIQRTTNNKNLSFRKMTEIATLDPMIDFVGASLPNMDFRGEDLRGFNFSKADLSGADFRNANLDGVKLKDADLTGAIGLPQKDNIWRARQAIKDENWHAALNYLDLAMEEATRLRDGSLPTIEYLLAVVSVRLERYDFAQAYLNTAMVNIPISSRDFSGCIMTSAELYYRLGKLEEQDSLIQRIVAGYNNGINKPRYSELISKLARFYMDRHDSGRAEYLVQALTSHSKGSDIPEYLILSADIYERGGNFSKAARCIARLVELDEESNVKRLARDYGRLADLAEMQGLHSERQRWLDKKKEVLRANRLARDQGVSLSEDS